MKRITITIVVLLAACGPQGPATVPPATLSGSDTPGIEGRVISISDVATVPDVALEGVGLAVFEQGMLEGNVQNLGADPSQFGAEVAMPGLASATTVTNQRGAYTVDLAPGDYYVCLVGFDMQQVQAPFTLNGCVSAAVAQGERLLLDLGWGLGGLYPY